VAGGSAKAPIPGDYWATYRDSLNVKWDGSASPSAAEKYGRAFGRTDARTWSRRRTG
jgi:hypothetical protein